MTGGTYIGCPDCGSELFTMTATSSETVKFKWDGGSLMPDVQKTQYIDGGYDSVDCQNCGCNFNIDDLEPEGRENNLVSPALTVKFFHRLCGGVFMFII